MAEYFVEYVRQQLDARFGSDLYRSGYRIYTTLDLDTQQAAERALEARLEAIESGADGKFALPDLSAVPRLAGPTRPRTATCRRTPYLQGLVVTLEAKTGSIRAMVGGRDFERQQVQPRDPVAPAARAPPSSRSSTRRRSRRATRCRT